MLLNLSIEIVLKIVKYLPTYERFKLRQLNKEWRATIDTFFKIQNLTSPGEKTCVREIFGCSELVYCYTIRKDRLSTVNFDLSLFKMLKRISINEICPKSIGLLNQLEKLPFLEYLDIDWIESDDKLVDKFSINSDALKYLRINIWSSYNEPMITTSFILNTPNLTNFKTTYLEVLDDTAILYPQSIKYLESEKFEKIILKFINLEVWFCYFIKNLKEDDLKDVLRALPKLKELNSYYGKNEIESLLQLREEFGNSNLKLTLRNFQVSDKADLDRFPFQIFYYSWFTELEIKFLGDNISKTVEKFNNVIMLSYNYLEDYYMDKQMKIPDEFISKLGPLPGLDVVKRIRDIESFIKLLSRCKRILNFSIMHKDSGLDQNFFNNLPSLCPALSTLCIKSEEALDLEFLFHFKILNRLQIKDQSLLIDTVKSLFENTELVSLECKIYNMQVEILFSNGYFIVRNVKYKNLDQFHLSLSDIY